MYCGFPEPSGGPKPAQMSAVGGGILHAPARSGTSGAALIGRGRRGRGLLAPEVAPEAP